MMYKEHAKLAWNVLQFLSDMELKKSLNRQNL